MSDNTTISVGDPRFKVLEVGISAVTLEQAVSRVLGWVSRRERTYVNVCTTGTVLECHDNLQLADIVNRAGMATPDGMPLVWLGRAKGLDISRVYGPDLMLKLVDEGRTTGLRHYFYGATEPVLKRLCERLTERFPGLIVAGMHAPPFRALTDDEVSAAADMINRADADIVWVGLGTPRQDFWLAQFRPLIKTPVLIAVGAAFNFHAGTVRQAPRWMMRIGMEWFFRLLMEPRRLWRRYLIGNFRFVWLLLVHQGVARKGGSGA